MSICKHCGRHLDRRNTSGLCRDHLLADKRSDPEVQARRIAALHARRARPENFAALAAQHDARTLARLTGLAQRTIYNIAAREGVKLRRGIVGRSYPMRGQA